MSNEWFMCTVWNDGIRCLDVIRETPKQLKLRDGRRLAKRYSLSQFIGKTKEEAKQKYILKLQSDLEIEMQRAENIKTRIETVKTW